MFRNFIKRFWPLIFIFVVWFTFSYPYFLKEKAPFAATYQLNNFAPWSAYPEFWGPVKNGAMPDVITQIYPWKHLAIQIFSSGQIPLWNPYSFAGTPLLANFQSAVLSPFNILFFILPFVDAWSVLVLLQPLLAGIFTYIFIRALKRSKIASLVSAVSFMFCGFITSWMGYATLGYAILFLPLSLFAVEKYFITKKSRYLALLSMSFPLSFFSGHFQISIYFLLSLVLYILYKFILTKDVGGLIKASTFVAFGILLSMPQLLPSIEFYLQSFRSVIFEKGEVIPIGYLPTLFAPDFFGNPVTRNDWFGHWAEWNGFIGVVPLMLSLYAVTLKKKKDILFFLIVGTAALLLALDTSLADLLIAIKIPVLSTSSLSRVIVIYSFMFAVLSAFGFDGLVSDIKEKKWRKIFIFSFAAFSLVMFLWIALIFKIYIPIEKIEIARNNLKLPTLILLSFLGVIFLSALNKKLTFASSVIILALVSFDMLRFAIKWQEFTPKNLVFINRPVTFAFAKISGFQRVIGNFGGEASVYYKLPSLEGYDALYIKRYGEFAASVADGKLKDSYRSVVYFPKDSPSTPELINLLDVGYIVHKLADGRYGWTFPHWKYPDGQFVKIYNDSAYEIYKNTKAFPHAFLVGQYRVIENPEQIIGALVSSDIDLRKEIILEQDPNVASKAEDVGSTEVIRYTPNEIEVRVNARRDGILFLSDNYTNGWQAAVDGNKTTIYRANYSFRAVAVKEGNHLVKFTYEPLSFKIGIFLAIVGALGIIAVSLFPRFAVPKASTSS